MKPALVLSWVAVAVLLNLHFAQKHELIDVRAKAELAWMETQTMPYVNSYDHRDDVRALRAEIQQLSDEVAELRSSQNR